MPLYADAQKIDRLPDEVVQFRQDFGTGFADEPPDRATTRLDIQLEGVVGRQQLFKLINRHMKSCFSFASHISIADLISAFVLLSFNVGKSVH